MNFKIQPILENEKTILSPLLEEDFEELFKIASDPKIWEQHPNKDRWQKEHFQIYFEGAIQSKGAFKIIDKATNQIIGSTRFYDYDETQNSIFIGYTFYTTACWGLGINKAVKKLLLDYIFQYVSKVNFHVGTLNIRSQIAIGRIGAKKVSEENIAYFGEAAKANFVYEINKEDW